LGLKLVWIVLLLLLASNLGEARRDGISSAGKSSKGKAAKSTKASKIRTESRDKNEGKAKSRRKTQRDVIIPIKKEKLATKAFRGLSKISTTLRSKAHSAVASVGRVNRDIKSYFSSDFEVLLLRMTRPDDFRPSKSDVDRFLATTQSFVRNMDLVSQSNTYRVTLRKIWAKVAEADGRTVLKALYMLHLLLRYSEPEDCVIYKNLLMKMSKEYSKKSKSKYFDIKRSRARFMAGGGRTGSGSSGVGAADVVALGLAPAAGAHELFVQKYAEYVVRRAKAFTSGFEEMRLIDYGMRTEDICAQLVKASKLLEAALDCLVGVQDECEVVVICLEQVAQDIRVLFPLFGRKLLWLLREHEVGDVFEGWAEEEVEALLRKLKAFYGRYGEITTFLSEVAEVLELYRVKLPVTLDADVTPDLLDQYVLHEPTVTVVDGNGDADE